MNCQHPIDAAILADYWLGMLSEQEEPAIEEHLLACDTCSARLRETIALAEGIRRLAGNGSLRIVVSDTFLRRAAEQGLRVREYAPPPGGSVACTVTAADDILISRLAAHLGASERVDLSLCDERGIEQLRLRDIPARAAAGGIIYQESMTFARELPTTTLIARLVGLDASGKTRPLGEYTFNHTRTPGPGGAAS